MRTRIRGSLAGCGALVAAALAILLAAPAGASAQDASSGRGGQWFAIGVGGGFDEVACGVCSLEPRSGVGGHLRFGGTVRTGLRVGAEVTGWTRSEESVRQSMGAATAIALIHPNRGPFYLKGGLGVMGFRAEDDGAALTALSFGLQAGVGYDLFLSDVISITPFVDLTVAPRANLNFNGDLAERGVTLALLNAGIGLTWH